MTKYAEVQKDSIVQLGRFNKDKAEHSYKTGIVTGKKVTKIGNSIWTAITVQVAPREYIVASITNIKAVLA